MFTSEKGQDAIKGNRIYFLDNLRTFMIFLVVLVHAGWVYESSGIGAFFWIVDDPSTNGLSGKMNLIIDIFVMSIIFFISGYFTPPSLKSKNDWLFLKSKFKRLFVPWVIAVFTLIPLYKIIFLYSRNIPQESWTTYFHFSNGIYSQNWLWFLPVLFLFNILYVLLSKININISSISVKKAVFAVFIIGYLNSVFMAMFNGMGWTKTFLLDFQNERLLIYFLIYLLGSFCFKQKIFESKPKGKKLYIAVLCTAWIPVSLYRFFYIQSFVYPGVFIF
ncbi:MAG: acyltransferase family protein, partial [Sedimentisphaerales bacterium]